MKICIFQYISLLVPQYPSDLIVEAQQQEEPFPFQSFMRINGENCTLFLLLQVEAEDSFAALLILAET